MPGGMTEEVSAEMIAQAEAELIGHLGDGPCLAWCGHCHEEWMIRSDWLGIEGVNLYEDHCRREEDHYRREMA